MEHSSDQKFILMKIDILKKQKDHLLNLVLDTDKIIKQAISWVENPSGSSNVTFKDINKMVDDNVVFLTEKGIDFTEYSTTVSHPESTVDTESVKNVQTHIADSSKTTYLNKEQSKRWTTLRRRKEKSQVAEAEEKSTQTASAENTFFQAVEAENTSETKFKNVQADIAGSSKITDLTKVQSKRRTTLRSSKEKSSQAVEAGNNKIDMDKTVDTNTPQSPRTAFLFFFFDFRAGKKNEDIAYRDLQKMAQEKWTFLSEEDKKPFEIKAQKYAKRYIKDDNKYENMKTGVQTNKDSSSAPSAKKTKL